MSIEERLNRLKNMSSKQQVTQRPASGMRKQLHFQKQPSANLPLDPIEFQRQLAQRTAEEKAKMEEFKLYEERMKAYQHAKKAGGKPPINQGSFSNLQNGANGQASQRNLNVSEPPKAAAPNPAPLPKRGNKTSIRLSQKHSTKNNHNGSGVPEKQRRSSHLYINGGGSQNSKSTTAHTNDRQGFSNDGDFQNPTDSELEKDGQVADSHNNFPSAFRQREFRLEEETGQRGAQPESNQIKESENKLIQQKRDKCNEIFRNNSDIRDMITSPDLNPQGLELSDVVNILFQDNHFVNLLGDLLTQSRATSKIEKFFSNQVRNKLRERRTDAKINESFSDLNRRIQERLNRLKNTKFEFD